MTAGASKSPSELRVEKSASHRRKFLGRGLPFQLRTNRLARTLFGLVQPGACAVLIIVFAWHGFSPFPCARHISAEFISYRALRAYVVHFLPSFLTHANTRQIPDTQPFGRCKGCRPPKPAQGFLASSGSSGSSSRAEAIQPPAGSDPIATW